MKLELKPRTDLTLRTIAALTDGRRWRAAQLAEHVGTTAAYLAHIVGPLTKAGWVNSAPGPTGGHRLTADLDSVTLLDIIEAVEGPTDDGRCVMATQPCPAPEPCAVHDTWLRARSALTAELASTSLRSITTEHHRTNDQKGRQP
ncbi:MAG TPA: Rrf2 family transcriptional regulator [Ilumatobacter sp.]|nr:Rrf2 family transcriptional regulator [Ilumatobacter sp.]